MEQELAGKIVGKNLRKYRKIAHLTQAQLAEKVGVSTSHISHAESGSNSFSIPTVIAITDALKITPDDLLEGAFIEPDYKRSYDSLFYESKNEIDPVTRILSEDILDLLISKYKVTPKESDPFKKSWPLQAATRKK